jgi:hypothetical protein
MFYKSLIRFPQPYVIYNLGDTESMNLINLQLLVQFTLYKVFFWDAIEPAIFQQMFYLGQV